MLLLGTLLLLRPGLLRWLGTLLLLRPGVLWLFGALLLLRPRLLRPLRRLGSLLLLRLGLSLFLLLMLGRSGSDQTHGQ